MSKRQSPAASGGRAPSAGHVALGFKVAIVFFAALTLGTALAYLQERNQVLARRQAALEIAGAHGHLLQERLERGLSATYALAALVRQGNGEIGDFDALAREMLGLYGTIGALAVAPDGIVTRIFPLAGNEGAVGHNLLRDPKRRAEALAAIASRQLTLAGPFPLRQGGVGVIGRLAVFLSDRTGTERFWGFTTAVLPIEDLLAASQLKAIAQAGHAFELARRDAGSGAREVFARSSPDALTQPVSFAFRVPNGEWTLSLAPAAGWHTAGSHLAVQGGAVLLASLLAAWLAGRLFRQPLVLRREVARQTHRLRDTNQRLTRALAEYRLTEKALRESEARFRNLADSAPVPIWIADARLRMHYLNPAWAAFSGHDASQDLGCGWLSALEPAARPAARAALRQLRATRQVFRTELRLRRHDGEYRWLVIQGVPRHAADGGLAGYIGTAHDITDHKQAEQVLREARDALELRVAARTAELSAANAALRHERAQQEELIGKLEAAQNQLLQSEKMAAVGQLAAGIAHEINNPVGFVYSNLAILGDYTRDLLAVVATYEACADPLLADQPALAKSVAASKQAATLDDLRTDLDPLLRETREGVERIRDIVRDVREFSRAAEAGWQLADLHRGLDSTINVVWNELKYKAEIVRDYGALPPVECLPAQINQVFMNLLVNAAHAITDKGTITIRSGHHGDMVWVELADTGGGIAPEIRHRIFEPFFTTKPVGKGTGLGLSVSYGIVQRHRGRIEVTSDVGRGSAFRVWLPQRQTAAADESARAAA